MLLALSGRCPLDLRAASGIRIARGRMTSAPAGRERRRSECRSLGCRWCENLKRMIVSGAIRPFRHTFRWNPMSKASARSPL